MKNKLAIVVFWVFIIGAVGLAGSEEYNRKCANAHKMNPAETCPIDEG